MIGIKQIRVLATRPRVAKPHRLMYRNRTSRALFAVEAVLLAALAIEATLLFTRILSNVVYIPTVERTILAPLAPVYFLLMLAASASLFCLVVDLLLNGSARVSPVLRSMTWIALAGAIAALIGFGIDAGYAKPDEGNLSRAAVWFAFAPFLFLWIPLVHIRLARAWGGHLAIGSSNC
jgi:hypothetical protein